MVSVAVVTGAAVGGGAELTTACDYRVLSSDAKIQFVQVKASNTLNYMQLVALLMTAACPYAAV
jgi:enoyl-CoA hydratase/carnithine racemase